MRKKMGEKSIRKNGKFHSSKWMIFGLVMGVVIATVGSVAALNGWFGGGGTIPEDTMTRGLVGYWGFDEGSGTVAHDASNYANNGVASSTWATGKVGGAAKFDGVDDYVDVIDSASLNITTAITIATWIKTNTVTGGEDGIVSKMDYNNKLGYHLELYNTGLIVYLGNGAELALSNPTNVITVDTWHYIVMTWDGTVIRTYVNGLSTGVTTNFTGPISNTPDSLRIGVSRYSSGERFNGLIDEVRIYNRVLSAEEVRYHYNRGGPVAQWKMDEGEGRTVYDSTENNNDGTLVLGGSATSSAWVAGKYGTALAFDGVDDYMSVADANSLDITSAITVEAWVKPSNLSGYKTIVDKYFASARDNFLLTVNDDNLEAHIDNGASNVVYSAADIITTDWQYVTLTFNGSYIKLFRNGINVLETARTISLSTSNESLFIGKDTAWSRYFTGLIDDVRIYNYARTVDEIRLDYNAGFAVKFGYTNAGCQRDPASCMTQGLVGYWPFDSGSGSLAYDASENGNNGTLTAGPSWTTGKKGGALSFDGSDDSVSVSNNDVLNPSVFTLEAWIRVANVQAGEKFIIQKGATFANPGYALSRQTTGEVRFNIGQTGGETILQSVAAISENTWGHAVVTFDGTTMRAYVNGVLDVNTITPPSYEISTAALYIGYNIRHAPFAFDGLIDEVRIYNRALSAEEIRYHYNKGGPVAQWKMDEGEGSTVYDSTENNNDGTLVLAGSATSSAWVEGKYGSALSFDGVDDYVNAGNGASLSPTNALSVEFWAYPKSPSAVGLVTSKQYMMEMWTEDSKWNGRVRNTVPANKEINSAGTVDGNVWQHIVFTADGSTGSVKLYKNGVEIGSNSYSAFTMETNAYNFLIGAFNNGGTPSDFFKGLIDDVRIYNYARTPDEIRLDYNAGFAAHFGPSGRECKDDPAKCMTEGLVGYWGFEEGSGTIAHDSSNYTNDGTLTSGPSWTKGKVGSALSFDGVDDYVNAGNGVSLDIANAITIEAWINAEILNSTGDAIIYKHNAYAFEVGSTGYLRLALDTGAFTSHDSNAGEISTGAYYHVVGTYDGINWRLYKNGVEIKNGALTGAISTNTNIVRIGQESTSGYEWDGLIDEVRVYNRVLSAEEVRYHYNKGGPVAEWKMDEGEGRTVYDSTENNNDGTLVLAGSATSSAWVKGKYGSALSFDGTNDYVVVPESANLRCLTAVTVEAWTYLNSNPVGDKGIAGKGAQYANNGYFLGFMNNNIRWNIGSGDQYFDSATTIALNQWHHIVATFDGTTARIFIDGVQDINTRTATYTPSSVHPVYIGSSFNGEGFFFNGFIDDVRIYNYARTAEQIRLDYNQGLSAHFK